MTARAKAARRKIPLLQPCTIRQGTVQAWIVAGKAKVKRVPAPRSAASLARN